MNGITVKLDEEQLKWLQSQARTKRCSKAAILRELIDRRRAEGHLKSLHYRMRDWCGSLEGSVDLSTRKLTGYGRD